MLEKSQVFGALLAGGRSSRFGSNKAYARLLGRPLIYHVMERARPQVAGLVVAANAEIDIDGLRDLPTLADVPPGGRGPLAGILAALEWAVSHAPGVRCIATFPVDSPLFPHDLVARLAERSEGGTAAVIAQGGDRLQPVFGLWPVGLIAAARRYLIEQRRSALGEFALFVDARVVPFAGGPPDPFVNINRQEDLAKLEGAVGHDRR
ncbi:MAG: molybdenum cofactor guanylyltransferase [Pseudomonadota bacterium]|jgi:molybdopterin-guanine dinucleotide biosynthesis protein A